MTVLLGFGRAVFCGISIMDKEKQQADFACCFSLVQLFIILEVTFYNAKQDYITI